jgi:YihY family inner membrane protein
VATRTTIVNRTRGAVELLRKRFAEHELLTYAGALAFQVVKSLIPLSLLGIALLGAVGRRDVWTKHIAPALKSRLEPPTFHAIDAAVEKIFTSNSAGLIVFSVVLTVWFVSGGVRAIMGGINRIYEVDDKRPYWVRWPLSLGLAFCVVGGIVGATLLVEAVPKQNGSLEILLDVVRWLGALAALIAVTGVLVRLAPVRPRPKRWASAGAVLVVATWIVTSFAFRWYVDDVRELQDRGRPADRLPCPDGLCVRLVDRPAGGDRNRRTPAGGRQLGRTWHHRRAVRTRALTHRGARPDKPVLVDRPAWRGLLAAVLAADEAV